MKDTVSTLDNNDRAEKQKYNNGSSTFNCDPKKKRKSVDNVKASPPGGMTYGIFYPCYLLWLCVN